MARTRIVIDTDPGVDDAVAILLALASEELDVLALTSVAGNVDVDQTTRNARRLIDLAGRPDVPVARGAAGPLVSTARFEDGHVHGHDGLGDLTWDEPAAPETGEHAVDLIARRAREAPLTIVAIGPLTNLALLRARYPGIESAIERVVIMGGASFAGNVTAAAEFNVWFDPEAAASVLAGPWPITLLPLDLTHQATLTDVDLAYFAGLGTQVGTRVAGMLEPYAAYHERWHGNRDVIMHDATAVYEVLVPGAIASRGAHLAVETGGTLTRGMTVIDRRRAHAERPTRVGEHLDREHFVALVRERLARYPLA